MSNTTYRKKHQVEAPGEKVIANAATTLVTYDKSGTLFPPRAVRMDAAGTFEFTDWEDNTSTMTVLQGEVIDVSPKTITANTTIITHSIW